MRLTRVLCLVAVVVAGCGASDATAVAGTPPPAHAGFDYQIGGGYDPPEGVTVVSRDHGDQPAAGLYNICYVNAFQAQEGSEDSWGDLVLRDDDGEIVYDEEWHEALLDIRTADKRQRIADRVNVWVDECAEKGFQAVEPDNYDSYSRSQDLLTDAHAQAHIRLLSAYAHEAGLAIGQKNTVELAHNRVANGLDFAVAEECGFHDECGDYATWFDDNVIVIEYDEAGLVTACDEWAGRLSIVLRDGMVSTPDNEDYLYRTC